MGSTVDGAQWRKSSFSGGNGGGCVEVADNLPGRVAVRDSKNPSAAVLTVRTGDWRRLTAAIQRGRLDLAVS